MFSWKSNCTYKFWAKVPTSTLFLLVQHGLFNIPIWKPMAPAYHNTITFDPYLLNSRSNVMCLLSLRAEVQLVPKSGAIVLSTRWESNVHFIMEVFLNGTLKCSFRFQYYLFLNILLFDWSLIIFLLSHCVTWDCWNVKQLRWGNIFVWH